MANPFHTTSTGNINCPSGGIIEIIMLKSYMENSQATVYEGSAQGRRLWDIAVLANDSKITPILNLPYSGGIYVDLSGTGAGLSVTVR